MIVVHKIHNHYVAINLDNVIEVECEKYQGANYGIYFNFVDGQGVCLASYPKQTAIDLYNDLIQKWANGGCNYYELP